jgi:hypothetical protein
MDTFSYHDRHNHYLHHHPDSIQLLEVCDHVILKSPLKIGFCEPVIAKDWHSWGWSQFESSVGCLETSGVAPRACTLNSD